MKTAVNHANSPAFGKLNKFSNTPVYQVVNDVGSSVRWISGQMISLEYGEHASHINDIKDWDKRNAQSIEFQRRFDALNDDVNLAVALDNDIEQFKEEFLLPLLNEIEGNAIQINGTGAAEAV